LRGAPIGLVLRCTTHFASLTPPHRSRTITPPFPSMIYIILNILCSVWLVVVFKYFDKYRVQTFQAIVINYWTCFVTGCVVAGSLPHIPTITQSAWFPYALMLGVCFISGFYAIANTVQKFGLAVGSVVQKMSLIIPVAIALVAYGDPVTPFKLLGILAALISILLTNYQPADTSQNNAAHPLASKWLLLIPLYVFLVSGFIDATIQYCDRSVAGVKNNAWFVTSIFALAGIFGTLTLIYSIVRRQTKWVWTSVPAGIILGIPNYFSTYSLLKAIGQGWQGSVIFPVINVSIIGVSILSGIVLFRERINRWQVLGVGCAVLSILLITR
jgi:multidrug transporter EmrE-like cation transporter